MLAVLVGVEPALVPPDWGAFRRYFDGMIESDLLAVTPLARDIAETVLNPPADAGTARLARSITSGLLPPRLRDAFGLPWDAERERRLEAMIEQVRGLRRAAPEGV